MLRAVLIAGTALALTACGGGASETNQTDLAVNNLIVDDPAAANALMTGDANISGDLNVTVDANTQNAVEQDLKTNDADTNLANGL